MHQPNHPVFLANLGFSQLIEIPQVRFIGEQLAASDRVFPICSWHLPEGSRYFERQHTAIFAVRNLQGVYLGWIANEDLPVFYRNRISRQVKLPAVMDRLLTSN